MTLHVIYRLSDNGYPKVKFEYASKIHCLKNFLTHIPDNNFHLLLDETNLKDETYENLLNLKYSLKPSSIVKYVGGSSASSWRFAWQYMKDLNASEDCVYFVEDDYLHRKDSFKVLMEGLQVSDYVSLYDHNDKYIPASKGGNMFVDEDGGEVTKVIRTMSSHWKITNSTTMTFAANIKTLLEDEEIWNKWTLGTHPNDFQAFLELRSKKNRSLITPIPGYSTHCEPMWASPGIDWSLE